MTKGDIQQALRHNYSKFIKQINDLSDSNFLHSNNGKWTAGQQLDHIIKSVSPVNRALRLPSFFLRILFGKANRPSRGYDALVERYRQKLSEGGKAPAPFIPKPITVGDREDLSRQLHALINSLIERADSFSEEQLDTLILPHPLLGKITLREMLCFTIYHVQHHEKQVMQNLVNSNTKA